jgi:hypothetical protein
MHFTIIDASSSNTRIRSIVVSRLPFCYIFVPLGSRLYRDWSPIRLIIRSASPYLVGETSFPPYSWSCRLKSPASIILVYVPILFCLSWISWYSLLVISCSASMFFPLTYTDTTSTNWLGRRSTAAVRSADCTGTYLVLISFRVYSMLRTAYLSLY